MARWGKAADGIDPAAFCRDYWQKKPLLLRGAFPDFEPPISAEELAGLAGQEGVDSRLIVRAADGCRTVAEGPLTADDFSRLPSSDWTVLVQAVDRWVPEVAELLDRFRFIPNWRIDDLMVSYAAPGGGVGPHVDNYDVFLLQGLGRRRWRIDRRPVVDAQRTRGSDLALLERFEPDAEWDVEPGDMLYLPPRIAHDGVALDASLTFSIGFRAPLLAEIQAGYLGWVVQAADRTPRYADPGLRPTAVPGEISVEAREAIRKIVRELPLGDENIDRWFGRFVTEQGRDSDSVLPDAVCSRERLNKALDAGSELQRTAVPCFAHIQLDDGRIALFVGGEEYLLDASRLPLAELLTGTRPLTAESLGEAVHDPVLSDLLLTLVNRGFLFVEPGS